MSAVMEARVPEIDQPVGMGTGWVESRGAREAYYAKVAALAAEGARGWWALPFEVEMYTKACEDATRNLGRCMTSLVEAVSA